MHELLINGTWHEFDEPIYAQDILTKLGLKDSQVAIAINAHVLPRSRWSEPIAADSTIEILTAFQGG